MTPRGFQPEPVSAQKPAVSPETTQNPTHSATATGTAAETAALIAALANLPPEVRAALAAALLKP